MMRLLADENFHNDILRGLRNKLPEIDVVRVQDTEIFQADDPIVLEWAANQERILLTHDVRTMPKYAFERVESGLPMPGIIEVRRDLPIGDAIEEFLIVIGAGESADFENQVRYIPLH